MEEWLVNMMDFAEMVKLISLIREKAVSTFIADWKTLIGFLRETGKKILTTYSFND